MRANVPGLLFPSRGDFRAWLQENAEASEGVWLVFGKTKTIVTEQYETKSSLSEIVQNTLRFFLVGGIIAAWSSGIIAAWSSGIIAERLLPVHSNS